jgi:hypothetical protein
LQYGQDRETTVQALIMNIPEAAADKQALAAQLRANLVGVRSLRSASVLSGKQAALRMQLRGWQAARFERTYADLMASDRYRPAAEFFLSDLYGPKDFSGRDEGLERVLPAIAKILPASAIRTLAVGVELDLLSESLDAAMVQALLAAGQAAGADISEAAYAKAYRTCDNRRGREAQIALLMQIGDAIDKLTRMPLLRAAIALIKAPAHAAGMGELHHFLDRGFYAFRHMQGAAEFLAIIRERESQILARLFARHRSPFDLNRE